MANKENKTAKAAETKEVKNPVTAENIEEQIMSENKMEDEIVKAAEEEIQKAVVDILVDDFECDRGKLTPEVNLFTDLDLDSIDAVDLVVRLQQVTKKKVNPEDFRQIRTLRDVVKTVYKLVNE